MIWNQMTFAVGQRGDRMDDKLKPCPFCGSKMVRYVWNIDMEPDGITCYDCHIVVRFSRITVRPREYFEVAMGKMADIWNRRAE